MAIQGLRSTADFVADQRPKNWKEGYLKLEPNGMAPLTALTSLMKSRTVDDPEFYWWEKERNARRFTLTANITDSQTTIPVASGADLLKEGDVVMIEQTGEIVRLVADGNPTSITVARAQAGTAPAAVTFAAAGANPNLLYIGSAYEEGSLAPTPVRYDPTKHYNYTQIFRDTIGFTRTASKTRLRTPDDVAEAKKECLEYHMQGIERAFWFGRKLETTHNGEPLRYMGGVHSFIDSGNVIDVAGTNANGLTMETLEEYFRQIFTYGSSEKMGFCGNAALLVLNQVVRKNAHFNIQSGIKEYGMNVTRLTCPFGELVLKTHAMFNQVPGGVTAGSPYYGLSNDLTVLDMAQLKYVAFNGADTQYEAELTPIGLDGKKSGYLTECSLEMGQGKTHFRLKNINKAADVVVKTQTVAP